MRGWTLSNIGDSAVVVEFEQKIDPAVNARVLAVAEAVRRAQHRGVLDVLEGFCTVTVVFDPLETNVGQVVTNLELEVENRRGAVVTSGRELTLPVCYGGRFGPDLASVAAFGRCSEQDVIMVHSGSTYRVYMLGFLPGFAYMGTVDPNIAMPRRVCPRVRVPAGSLGIAGAQTGLYPLDAPGGWQLIGRCPVRTFDMEKSDPFLFRAGDIVRFEAITEEEYQQFE